MNIKEIHKYPGELCFIGPEYPGDLQSSRRFAIIQEICNHPGDLQLSSRFSLPRPWISMRFANIHVIWASWALNVPEICIYTGDLCFIGPKYPGDSRFIGPNRASTKGRNLASLPVQRILEPVFTRVQIVLRPVRWYKTNQPDLLLMP